jgi:hypothetical protein
MSTSYWIFIHVLGVMLLTGTLGALVMHLGRGGDRGFEQRKLIAILHGVSLLFLLLSGVAVIRMSPLLSVGPWLYGKLIIWLFLGMSPTLLFRKIIPVPVAIVLFIFAFALAAGLGIFSFAS